MARKIVLTSGKGGVGKTTISANLGYALARLNQKVVILDVDIGLNNLDVVLGLENRIVFDIVDCIEGKCRLKQALIQDTTNPFLYILPSCQSLNSSHISISSIKFIVDELSEMFDYILIDCPAGIDIGFHRAVFSASEALLITTPHISALKDADKVLDILTTYNLNSIGLIVNRTRGDLIASQEMASTQMISQLFNIELVGVLPEDDIITTTLSCGGAIRKKSKVLVAFEMLAKNIHYGTREIYTDEKEYKGLFGYLKRSLKKSI